MGQLDFTDKMNEISKTIESPEHMLGKGLLMPFNGANAGARKIMYGTHRERVNGIRVIMEDKVTVDLSIKDPKLENGGIVWRSIK